MLLQGYKLALVQLKSNGFRVELLLSLRMLPLIPPHQELYMEQTMYPGKKGSGVLYCWLRVNLCKVNVNIMEIRVSRWIGVVGCLNRIRGF